MFLQNDALLLLLLLIIIIIIVRITNWLWLSSFPHIYHFIVLIIITSSPMSESADHLISSLFICTLKDFSLFIYCAILI